MEGNRLLRKSGVLILAGLLALTMCTAAAFADEIGSTVTIQITAGEHGSVNEKMGSFTESVASGGNLTLDCKADEGYVIDSIVVNDAEVEEADLGGILHQASGNLTLEDLMTGLSVTVGFAEEGTEASVETGTMDEETGDDLEAQTLSTDDEPGSLSTGEDPDAEVDLDDGDQSGGEETQPGMTDTEDSGDSDSDSREEADQTSDEGKVTEETGKTPHETSDGSASESGKSGKGDAADADSKGGSESADETYSADNSPKTGDAFPMSVIFAMLASLCALAGIVLRQLLKRRSEDA